MRRCGLFTMVFLAIMICAIPCTAGSILIGTPAGGNYFPFGSSSGTIYQQVYASANFSSAIQIVGITFFNSDGGGSFGAATYNFSLSTTSMPVDGLNTSDFDANLGPDNQSFASVALSGPTGTQFTITGVPFFYDPSEGNLLVDLRLPSASVGGSASMDATSSSGGLFSRAHNFGTGFAGYGLVTQFETADSAVPEPSTITLFGAGMLLLPLIRRLRQ